MPHFVYILFSEAANRCYIGCSCDPMQQIEEHMLHRYDELGSRMRQGWQRHPLSSGPMTIGRGRRDTANSPTRGADVAQLIGARGARRAKTPIGPSVSLPHES